MPITTPYDLTGFGGGIPVNQPNIYYVAPVAATPPTVVAENLNAKLEYPVTGYGGTYINKPNLFYVAPVAATPPTAPSINATAKLEYPITGFSGGYSINQALIYYVIPS